MTITLNSYILADGIAADQTAKTDARGKVVFDNLTAGIYLVSSVRTEQDGKYYVLNPSWRPCQGWTVRGSGCIPSPQGQK